MAGLWKSLSGGLQEWTNGSDGGAEIYKSAIIYGCLCDKACMIE